VAEQTSTEAIGRLIDEMRSEMDAGPSIYRPSRFWEILGTMNSAQLTDAGFDSFKRTINQNYFNWLIADPRDPQFRAVIKDGLRHPAPSIAWARLLDARDVEVGEGRFKPFAGRRARIGYAVFVALLWEYVRRRDRLRLLNQLTEPSLGAPILVRHGGRSVSQDLANSLLEFYAILEAFPNGIPDRATVVELGGGYGRLGWLLLSALPGMRYIAVDVPPALAVAQTYLTRLFPELPAERFRRGGHDLVSALDNSRLAFLTPNQLDVVPSLKADLFINISSLHEMRPDQVAHYFSLIGRHTRGVFYTKQWREWSNPHDGVTMRESDYPVPTQWKRIYERPHGIQTHFFEAAYLIS
jgi:putative sugar O-methyltransferase